jgi:hypothetical protein
VSGFPPGLGDRVTGVAHLEPGEFLARGIHHCGEPAKRRRAFCWSKGCPPALRGDGCGDRGIHLVKRGVLDDSQERLVGRVDQLDLGHGAL